MITAGSMAGASGALPGVREAYDASSAAWAVGPHVAYQLLATHLVSCSPVPVAGARVLDVGAGSGVAGRAVQERGARSVVGIDLSIAMLQLATDGTAAIAVMADVARLPFCDNSFDLAVAACCLGHLPDPGAALVEARRVAPAVAASAFLAGWTHPAKAGVDAVAEAFGFVVPAWYRRLKADVEPQVDDPARLAALATAAGYRHVDVTVEEVPVGLVTAAQQVDWRLGMAHLAPFVAGLAPGTRDELRRHAEKAIEGAPPLRVPLVVLAAH